MTEITRRDVISRFTAATGALAMGSAAAETGKSDTARPSKGQVHKPAFVLCSDLYRPHDDFDDHLDLALSFALAHLGFADLKAVLIDHPRNVESIPAVRAQWRAGVDAGETLLRNPDMAAVAQLNYITSLAVPAAVGPIWPGKVGDAVTTANAPKALRGVKMLLDVLEHSAQPVSIVIVGSTLNVAIAGAIAPELFAEKCAGVYLNAGLAQNPVADGSTEPALEWNVRLNPGAYAAIFALPCPVYWLPCFDDPTLASGKHGSFWTLRYGDLFPKLSSGMKNHMSYVLRKKPGIDWLSYLLDTDAEAAIREFNIRTDDVYYFPAGKAMYSTPSFFHACGRNVADDGAYPAGLSRRGVYDFLPIEVECSLQGLTSWRFSEQKTNRYILTIKDPARYGQALSIALCSILSRLP